MTDEKILAAVEHYRTRFKAAGVKRARHDSALVMKSPELALAHCRWMLDGIVQFVDEGKSDKAQRWLCFVQGVIWMTRFYTINDMREHNR